jgi:hypothetical protein
MGRPLAIMALTLASACHRTSAEEKEEIAALRLTCVPVAQGIRCQVLALFRIVARAPRDVTAEAVWRVDGGATGATISKAGIVHAKKVGEVEILAEFRSKRAYVEAWLAPGAPGELLGTVQGHVYVEQDGELQPLGQVRVEVAAGRNAGRRTTTAPDGSYVLGRLHPGQIRLRASGWRYISTEETLDLLPGRNQLSLLMRQDTAPNPPGSGPREHGSVETLTLRSSPSHQGLCACTRVGRPSGCCGHRGDTPPAVMCPRTTHGRPA